MRLLDRYLLREVLAPLVYCLCGFSLFLIFSDLFTQLAEFQKKKLHGLDVAEYYVVVLPEFLIILLPIALLLALLYALSNHARHQEITAIRAAGVGLWRLCVPYLALGFFGSLCLFALNELWVPQSTERAEQILNRRLPHPGGALNRRQVRNLGFNNSRDNRAWQIGVYNLDTAEMTKPKIHSTLPDGSQEWIYAERGERIGGVWTFFDVSKYIASAEPNSLPSPVLKTNILRLPQLTETPEQIKSEVKLSTGSLRPVKSADVPIAEILNYLRLHPNPHEAERYRLFTKLHGRFAAPWTCLVVVLIAIPFGAGSGRRNVFVGVASSILICFAYFVVQQVALGLGSGGHIPPWLAAWLPNLAFGLTGVVLTSRVR